jgi:Polysaccharide lyase
MVTRTQICQRDLPREIWTTVQVRLNPAHDASGQVDIWLNGTFCRTYRGPMADRDYGARRNGAPFINAQPRFGIYRDWRAETQTIYFDKIMFWNAHPWGHPDWGNSAAGLNPASISLLIADDEPDVADLFRRRFRRDVRQGTYVMHFANSARGRAGLAGGLVKPTLLAVLSAIKCQAWTGGSCSARSSSDPSPCRSGWSQPTETRIDAVEPASWVWQNFSVGLSISTY